MARKAISYTIDLTCIRKMEKKTDWLEASYVPAEFQEFGKMYWGPFSQSYLKDELHVSQQHIGIGCMDTYGSFMPKQ